MQLTESERTHADREPSVSVRGAVLALGGVVVWFAVTLAGPLVIDGGGSGGTPTLIEPDAPAWVVSNVVVGPVAEEIAWRGVVQTALDRWAGPAVAVAVTISCSPPNTSSSTERLPRCGW